jgi:hypothetical protein
LLEQLWGYTVGLENYLSYFGAVGTLWALYERLFTIRKLQRDKKGLEKEIAALRDEEDAESIKLVERTLLKLDLPMCAICREVLFLRLSTTFVNAIERLDSIPGAVAKSATVPAAVMTLVLETLEKASTLGLWSKPLQNSDNRPDPERELVRHAIQGYKSLIPQMSKSARETAIRFCVESCEKGKRNLKREAAVLLLPTLLVASRGDQRLVEAYSNLLGTCRTGGTAKEQEELITGVFSGLPTAATVDSLSVKIHDIWDRAFTLLTTNAPWGWENPNIGTWWCIAIDNRLPHSNPEERVHLRSMIAHYMQTPDAPSHTLSYHQIARVAAEIRQSIQSDASGFRLPDRAVVPMDTRIIVQITLTGSSSAATEARLVNFSLDDADGRVLGGGAWATSSVNPQWPPVNDWRDASVIIQIPQEERRVLFEQARVQGPTEEGEGSHYCGFRIQLGPASSEEGINPLRRRWDIWPKR